MTVYVDVLHLLYCRSLLAVLGHLEEVFWSGDASKKVHLSHFSFHGHTIAYKPLHVPAAACTLVLTVLCRELRGLTSDGQRSQNRPRVVGVVLQKALKSNN